MNKTAYDKMEIVFHEALYNLSCPDCWSKLEWEAAFDADGTNYYADCCDKSFCMCPATVKISVEDKRG